MNDDLNDLYSDWQTETFLIESWLLEEKEEVFNELNDSTNN